MNPSIFADAVTLPRALVAPDSFRPFEWAWLDESIPACFARHVTAHPQVIAVQSAGASLSYEQLGRMANRLATCLLERLGCELEPVAILTGSDLNAVVAMMGILTAGKFFVAINPDSSQHEMQAILEDSGARALVTDSHSAATALSLETVAQIGLPLFQVDRLNVAISDAAPAIPMTGATYAQIAYTSGSTGTPKGILKTHRALLHQSMTHINGYFITSADRMMAPAPLIFGASLGIVFSALLGGATLLPIRLKDYTAAQLRDWLRDEQVTVYHSVASFFRQFAATLDGADTYPGLRIIKLGGEAIQPEDIRLYRQVFSDDCVLRIGLASTEAGNYCWYFVGKETAQEGPAVPVGRPLVGTEILLLDEHREPVAHGEIGEIAVRSAYLASGYWRNPDLTHARFLPDPTDSQKTVYLTGDLGRWRDDGLLEHLGRADQMVKIRGNRVEIGAVEAALLALPAIKAAAVVAVEGAGGARRLIAYLAPGAERLTASELRVQLRASLPDFMVPARFVWIDRLPRLPSGKIDRAALPSPGAARPDLDTPFVAPRNELEQQIADIWAELLELDEVGVEDDFFELGGDSLLAMRMALTVEKAMGDRVLTGFFGEPTVAHLAQLMSGETATEDADGQSTTMRSFGSISGQAGRSTPRNLVRHLTQTGPFWRGHALPYGLGVRLQRALVAQPWFQQRFYARQLEIVRRWQVELGAPQDDQALIISLLANTWLEWRIRALTKPGVLERWVTMGGESGRLFEQPDPPCGIVMAVPHVGRIIAPLQRMIQLHGRETARVTNDPTIKFTRDKAAWAVQQTQSRTAQLWQAQQVLRRNGVVFIAGDGRQGHQTVDVSFRGRRLPFQIGAAELSIETGALFIPAFITFDATGRVQVEVTAPLTAQPGVKEKQIIELTRQYGTLYAARWPQFYASVRWHLSTYHLNLPVV